MLMGRIFKIILVGVFLAAGIELVTKSDVSSSAHSEIGPQAGLTQWLDIGVERATKAYHMLTSVSACERPLAYRIGELDERFNFTIAQTKRAISRAEDIWEEPTGRSLFFYDESVEFTINFVFDERQDKTIAAKTFQNELDQVINSKSNFDATYRTLMERHDRLSAEFAIKKRAFESQLNAYNSDVARHNERGGASQGEYRRLNSEQEKIAQAQVEIDNTVKQLNNLADQINDTGNRNNQLVERYNEDVEVFNNQFGGTREFTQGDYQGDHINVYQFRDRAELILVLAHELGPHFN